MKKLVAVGLLTLAAFGVCSGSAIAAPPASADLSIITTDGGPAVQGGNITYTLSIANTGPDPAVNVIIANAIPAGTKFVSASGGCLNDRDAVYCGAGTVASGATGSFQIVVRPDVAGKVRDDAWIASDTADPNAANNASSDTATVNGSAVAFGSQVNQTPSATKTLVIATEGGPAPDSISVTGTEAADFPITAQDCAPAPSRAGFFCQTDVHFTPSASGPRTATLTATFASGEPVTIPLTGTGIEPLPANPITQVVTGHVGNEATPGTDGAATCRVRRGRIVCSVVFSEAPTATHVVAVRVTRKGRTFAYGSSATNSRTPQITLRRKRRLRLGGYTLTLTVRDTSGRVLSTKRGSLRVLKRKR